MMKRISIVLLIVLIEFASIGINFNISYAGEASISAPSSVNVGDSFTVTVGIPSDAVAYNGEISVKFSDGTVQNSGVLAVVTGITGDFAHPGNMSYNFSAKSEGTATITVSNLTITDRNGTKVNSQKTLSGSVSVVKKQETPATPAAPSTPSTPAQPSTPTSSTPASTTSNEPSWTNTGDTVAATETVNVRSGWGTSYSSLGKLAKGSTVTRNAKGSNGWDKVSFKGQTGYILSKYLTVQNVNNQEQQKTDENQEQKDEIKWQETGDKVYATAGMNVRSGPGTTNSSIGGLKKGDSVTRIAVGSNGWDKIKYGGKEAYVLSKLLTTKEVEPDEEEENTNTTEENTNVVNQAENLVGEEKDVYNRLVEEVGVLPTVGRNFADYIYVISVCAAIGMIAFVGLKTREKNEN